MVHLDKAEGQTGSMVLQEDGSILSSSGDLSSAESTAQTFLALVADPLHVDFNANPQGGQNGHAVAASDNGSTSGSQSGSGPSAGKWNRIAVSFGDHMYVACLSNRKVHVLKRDINKPEEEDAGGE